MAEDQLLALLRDKRVTPAEARRLMRERTQPLAAAGDPPDTPPERIAVVGMSGRYATAGNLEQYWDILRDGRSAVREIPAARWDMERYYDPRIGHPGSIYCRWMGMLDDVDCFDSAFFQIAASEAAVMDPLHRIFLEESYRALEDAGYTRQRLTGSRCGIYLGMVNGDYQFLAHAEGAETPSVTSVSNAVAAARLAYFLNLKGPALTVDTACSSSLVGVHLAVQALRSSEIDMAVAGGAALYLSPDSYVHMSEAGMLSPDGQCRAFDDSANGIVVGEGAGAVVLKRLADAERDGDHIHGIIVASGINQDGKTNGITAPNLASQADLVTSVYERHGINPETIDYAEMHGTGTKLGDPVELEALATAFRKWTDRREFCAIGSVKSNVGHMSAAAGVAGLHKLLLALREQTLPPTLHVQRPNRHFDFAGSPFRINTDTRQWPTRPGSGRRAALSSFGFSGTNAHLVVEEYIRQTPRRRSGRTAATPVFPLSAATPQRLREYAGLLAVHLAGNPDADLDDLAYTLQTGREPMRERLAVVTGSRERLIDALEAFARDGSLGADTHRGDAGADASPAARWAAGETVDWERMWPSPSPSRVPLPTYPFEKKRHWYQPDAERAVRASGEREHPLLHRNVSDLAGYRFRSTFGPDEPLLADHRVDGTAVLPGAAVLEMARAAAARVGRRPVAEISQVLWQRAVRPSGPGTEVSVSLLARTAVTADFEVRDGSGELCVTGRLILTGDDETPAVPAPLEVAVIRSRCDGGIGPEEFYGERAEPGPGIWYGPGLRVVRQIAAGAGEVLATLELGPGQRPDPAHLLVPALLDGAWQAVRPLLPEGNGRSYLPWAVDRVRIHGAVPSPALAHVRPAERVGATEAARSFDLTIADTDGRVAVEVEGFTVTAAPAGTPAAAVLLTQRWEPLPLGVDQDTSGGRTLVVGAGPDAFGAAVRELGDIEVVAGDAFSADEAGQQYTVRTGEPEDVTRLWTDLRRRNLLPHRIVVMAPSDEQTLLDHGIYRMHELCRVLAGDAERPRVTLVYLYPMPSGGDRRPVDQAMGGYLRCLLKEQAGISARSVGITDGSAGISDTLRRELAAGPGPVEVWWDGDVRRVLRTRDLDRESRENQGASFRPGGVYLITGGLGGVGLLAARHLGQRYGARLVLTGRRPLDGGLRGRLESVIASGAEAIYVPADVSRHDDVVRLADVTRHRFGPINGVLHAAGDLHDGFIRDKSTADLAAVLAPKVAGTRVLDDVLRDEPLDLFVLYSSMSAVLGNAGQSDYCFANAFQDGFAVWRDGLRRDGIRSGHTVSIGWPYWTDGGMAIDAEAARVLRERLGITGLSGREGCAAMEALVRHGEPQITYASGDPATIRRAFGAVDVPAATPTPAAVGASADLDRRVVEYLTRVVSDRTRTDVTAIATSDPFETFGIDSIIMMSLTRRIEEDFGELPKTLFFEYRTIGDLAGYFVSEHAGTVGRLFGETAVTPPATTVARTAPPDDLARDQADHDDPVRDQADHDIAIVGIAGRYPDADDLDEFWANLAAGVDSIREVPSERWDHSQYFDPEGAPGTSYAKWGGFLRDIDMFDPTFFNIMPIEANFLDPQARLFLQTSWHALEDAGYAPTALRGQKLGVFVGVMHGLWDLRRGEIKGASVPASSSFAAIANRVSYFLDADGPSMAVDTMCSSSLTAIHLACASIRSGESDVAIAGGVNVTVHPNKLILLSLGRFAATDGRCRTFGEGGDGYVPGEGVGAVVLKSLRRAEADNDHIHAVIRGTAINSGGRTTGFTVPSPRAQEDLIRTALHDAGVPPQAISYVEAHGTGTALGDPIEIAGLGKAFGEREPGSCAIGSVKSNIGHLESAAGIGALTKVVLQMRHGRLVPSLHSATLNPYIDFARSPFTVQQVAEEWQRPDGHPRRAGISSFGAGGANAHLVVEEYRGPDRPAVPDGRPQLFVFSAQDDDRLREVLARFLAAARRNAGADSGAVLSRLSDVLAAQLGLPPGVIETSQPLAEYGVDSVQAAAFRQAVGDEFGVAADLLDADETSDLAAWAVGVAGSAPFGGADAGSLAFTLQTGREAMARRLAVVADDLEHLIALLSGHLAGDPAPGRVLTGDGRSAKQAPAPADGTTAALLSDRRLDRAAQLWVTGVELDWAALHEGYTPRRIPLPGYPFARERCWVSPIDPAPAEAGASLHPLVHRNTSTLDGLRFSTTFSGREPYLDGHRIGGRKVLPAVAYLEMALAAAANVTPDTPVRLRDVVWLRPFVSRAAGEELHVTLSRAEENELGFRVYSEEPDGTETAHCQGTVVLPAGPAAPETVAVEDLRASWAAQAPPIDGSRFYDLFERMGVEYGDAQRAIETVYRGPDEALVSLRMPGGAATASPFVLHPAILDAALQSALALGLPPTGDLPDEPPVPAAGSVELPFAVDAVHVHAAVEPVMWAHIRRSSSSGHGPATTLDIAVCDGNGKVAVRLDRVTFRAAGGPGASTAAQLTFRPGWQDRPVPDAPVAAHFDQWYVLLCGATAADLAGLGDRLPAARCRAVPTAEVAAAAAYEDVFLRLLSEIQEILRQHRQERLLIQMVTPAGESWGGLSGLARTVPGEHPAVSVQLIQTDATPTDLATRLQAERVWPADQFVRFRPDGRRLAHTWTEQPATATPAPPMWRDQGVYLVTGGARGLGALLSGDIARRARNVRLVLTGRSVADTEMTERMDDMRAGGATVRYARVDVTDAVAMRKLVAEIEREHGALNGVVHCAGVVRDRLLVNKTAGEARSVLAPKVAGVVALDEATAHVPLDLFLIFSSVAGALGNAGQADYAAANAFLDHYAVYRDDLVTRGSRRGRTLSINWQLWRDGGMRLGEEQIRAAERQAGLTVLETPVGLGLLDVCLATRGPSVLPLAGDPARLRAYVASQTRNAVEAAAVKPARPEPGPDRAEQLAEALKPVVAAEIGLDPGRLDPYAAWNEYGIDSVMTINLAQRLGEQFGPLPKTIFFENQNLIELAGTLCSSRPRESAALLGDEAERVVVVSPDRSGNDTGARPPASLDVAVVGLAGRYPKAGDLDVYWENLRAGRDCVTEVPADRWDMTPYYSPEIGDQDRTYAKWGGFLADADCFDPLFFNISPGEAEIMDPQERVFLECVQHVIEDAGYTPDTVAPGATDGLANGVGVFVGVMYEEYQLYAAQHQARGDMMTLTGSAASIANRVSYTFGFHGPSMALDTMCSSSLVALHLACQSILSGECEAAVAGGVNLSLHPNKFLMLGKSRFASTRGRCESFGRNGDGYTPGEGVGAVLLKPLDRALSDGDHIYGVIKGTAVAHGGRTNGYTVPDPATQTVTVRRALRRAGTDPRVISYVEAHGTGTRLGDPIEVSSLTRAMTSEDSAAPGAGETCYLGSVKSNIGHGESAAGIAGLTKVLLQMKHREIVPSLHSAELNPELDLAATPFVVPQQVVPWRSPELQQPLTAGISSFGAGGTTAHVVVAEYPAPPREPAPTDGTPLLIPLSARRADQLERVAERLLRWLRGRELTRVELADVAYTLQVGRESFEDRLGLAVTTQDELERTLADFLAGREVAHRGRAATVHIRQRGAATRRRAGSVPVTGEPRELIRLWAGGADVDWAAFAAGSGRQRVSLPAYPFARQRYWAPAPDAAVPGAAAPAGPAPSDPLLLRNTSSFFEQRFTATFTGREAFLDAHRVAGRRVLPGAVSLEMARLAGALSLEHEVRTIRDVLWHHPVTADDAPVELVVRLSPESDTVLVSIELDGASDEPVRMEATLEAGPEPGPPEPVPSVDLNEVMAGCDRKLSGSAVYTAMSVAGLDNGPAFQVIDELFVGAREAVALLTLGSPDGRSSTDVLQPALVNGVFQSVVALMSESDALAATGPENPLYLPFSIGRIDIAAPLPDECCALIRRSGGSARSGVHRFDISITDRAGAVVAGLTDYALKRFGPEPRTGE